MKSLIRNMAVGPDLAQVTWPTWLPRLPSATWFNQAIVDFVPSQPGKYAVIDGIWDAQVYSDITSRAPSYAAPGARLSEVWMDFEQFPQAYYLADGATQLAFRTETGASEADAPAAWADCVANFATVAASAFRAVYPGAKIGWYGYPLVNVTNVTLGAAGSSSNAALAAQGLEANALMGGIMACLDLSGPQLSATRALLTDYNMRGRSPLEMYLAALVPYAYEACALCAPALPVTPWFGAVVVPSGPEFLEPYQFLGYATTLCHCFDGAQFFANVSGNADQFNALMADADKLVTVGAHNGLPQLIKRAAPGLLLSNRLGSALVDTF